MRIAIASGKGGTGKTTVATSLATVLSQAGRGAVYVDCDVEEPNGHLFLRPHIEERERGTILVPEVDDDACTNCGLCREACRFSAILPLPDTVLVFPKLCHGCGGCALACPEGAITEVPRPIGDIESGRAGALGFVHGRLDVGEAMAPPLIRQVLEKVSEERDAIIDAPPGSSCPVVESVRSADVAVLVTEPTPFGMHDLELAVDMVRSLGIPFGLVVNRAGAGADQELEAYCEREGIEILMRIPYDRRIAETYAKGGLLIDALPGMRDGFVALADRLAELAAAPRPDTVELGFDPYFEEEPGAKSDTQPAIQSPKGIAHLVVVSGKGGTGKTSIVASLTSLASGEAVVADCDVDAADLHLVLEPDVEESWPYSGGYRARIEPDGCDACGECEALCRYDAISVVEDGDRTYYTIDPLACEGCGVCVDHCHTKTIVEEKAPSGKVFRSGTRLGPMVHARLEIGQENNGKLVSMVRGEAGNAAKAGGMDLVIVDGPPGIGCPVISSVTGADLVLVVAEPSVSALHDMKRVAELASHFQIPTVVCINKADLEPDMTRRIEEEADKLGVPVVGTVRYDTSVTEAQIARRTVVELGKGPAAEDIRNLWRNLEQALAEHRG